LPIFTSYTAQAASTYKLFPLLAALETGVPAGWQLQTPASGAYQWNYCIPGANGKVYNGDANENYNPGGNLTMREATARSSNTFFVGLADQLFGCQLQPIMDVAAKLGMKSLSQPSGEPRTTVAQSIAQYGSATRLTLGDIATSPLELTSAYAAIANDGRYNPPSPIKSITIPRAKPLKDTIIPVPRTAGYQAVTQQVAREAVNILEGDTVNSGTSAAEFTHWYTTHPVSPIAGKTGTAPGIDLRTHKDDKNGALWFVGMTPNLVATTALINLDNPSNPASGLPGVAHPAVNAFGQYAARVWITSLAPSLRTQTWTWPDPEQVNGDPVPDITRLSPADARRQLRQAGFKMSILGGTTGLNCASDVPTGEIAYFGPSIAPRGSTITVCPSSGLRQQIFVYHPPPPPKHSHSPGAGHGSGSSGSSAPPSGGGTRPGHGHGCGHGPGPG
ncbi:MAG: penicillin-binding transpeptidase domain-containing protein, partial [Jatrophihabitantaceae bacterium]